MEWKDCIGIRLEVCEWGVGFINICGVSGFFLGIFNMMVKVFAILEGNYMDILWEEFRRRSRVFVMCIVIGD